jgi:hypothetical protein
LEVPCITLVGTADVTLAAVDSVWCVSVDAFLRGSIACITTCAFELITILEEEHLAIRLN